MPAAAVIAASRSAWRRVSLPPSMFGDPFLSERCSLSYGWAFAAKRNAAVLAALSGCCTEDEENLLSRSGASSAESRNVLERRAFRRTAADLHTAVGGFRVNRRSATAELGRKVVLDLSLDGDREIDLNA